MTTTAALDALRAAVLDGDAARVARYADAAARAGASRGAVRSVIAQARRELGDDRLAAALSDPDPLRMVAEALDLSVLDEDSGSIVPRTRAAERHVGVGFLGDLADAIAHVIGSPTDVDLTGVLQRAREEGTAQGVATATTGATWRVLVVRRDPKQLRAVVARAAGAAAAAQTQRASEADLLATVNHEMANALTAIASIASFALRQPSDGALREAIEAVSEAASGTLSSMTAARKLTRRDPSDNVVATDASIVLAQLVDALRPLAERTDVRIATRLEADLSASIRKSDLRSVVWNLLKNAIEAVPSGGTVRVGATRVGDTLRIMVVDDGPGMTEEVLARAFEPYFSTKEAGMGLGLALVRETLERLGGRIGAESRVGSGSRFTVEIPCRADSVAPPATSGVVTRPRVEASVLLVGPSPVLAARLRSIGARVHEIGTSELAEGSGEKFDVAMIVTDGPDGSSREALAMFARSGIARNVIEVTTSRTSDDEGATISPDVDGGTLADMLLGLIGTAAAASDG
jgi:signal transduction histidine kinase